MDAILNEEHVFILENILAEAVNMANNPNPDPVPENMESELQEDVSLWIKEKDVFRPSTSIKITPRLDPGVYSIEFDREYGYSCKRLMEVSDELFVFSDSITKKLLGEINLFWEKKDLYAEHKLIHKRGILLEGYPGTGKSSIISQLSDAIIKQGGVIFKVTGFRNLDHYVQFMRSGFRQIQPDTPIITILEDIDQYQEVELELLDFLDGKTSLNHHVVIATTNNTENVPDTFLRPSRLDLKIEVAMPSERVREEYFQYKKVSEEYIPDLVKHTSGCSLADLKEFYVCIFLLDYSIEDAVSKIKTPKKKKDYSFNPRGYSKIGL
ncbi:MAG: AAA family ATPase [Candidatus Saccharimonadaceae bacterium]